MGEKSLEGEKNWRITSEKGGKNALKKKVNCFR